MEAIASNACFSEMPRQCKRLRDLCLATMERCVEARDLWDLRRHVQDGAYRCQVVRLVQRSQWYQLGQRSENCTIQPNWCGVMRSPMHDAMSDTDHLPSLDQVGSRSQQFARRGDMVEPIGRPVMLGDGP